MTNFRFTRTGEVESLERFNEKFQEAKSRAVEADQLINSLRGSCTKIRDHADHLQAEAERRGLGSWLGLLQRVLRLALDDVDGVLAPSGIADPARIPEAAALLVEYRAAFEPVEDDAFAAIRRLQELIAVLGRSN